MRGLDYIEQLKRSKPDRIQCGDLHRIAWTAVNWGRLKRTIESGQDQNELRKEYIELQLMAWLVGPHCTAADNIIFLLYKLPGAWPQMCTDEPG